MAQNRGAKRPLFARIPEQRASTRGTAGRHPSEHKRFAVQLAHAPDVVPRHSERLPSLWDPMIARHEPCPPSRTVAGPTQRQDKKCYELSPPNESAAPRNATWRARVVHPADPPCHSGGSCDRKGWARASGGRVGWPAMLQNTTVISGARTALQPHTSNDPRRRKPLKLSFTERVLKTDTSGPLNLRGAEAPRRPLNTQWSAPGSPEKRPATRARPCIPESPPAPPTTTHSLGAGRRRLGFGRSEVPWQAEALSLFPPGAIQALATSRSAGAERQRG